MASERETQGDNELTAMAAVRDALSALDDETRARVLRWASERFQVALSPATRTPAPLRTAEPLRDSASDAVDLATLYHEVSPHTDAEKVLAVTYWLQRMEGQPDVDAFGVNSQLKQLGFGVGNVTRAFDNLTAMRPQPIMQTRKSGTSRQARKKFKITDQGVKTIERMRQGQSSDMGADDA